MGNELSVNDHGLEATRKSHEEWPDGNAHQYRQRVRVTNSDQEPIQIEGSVQDQTVTTRFKPLWVDVSDTASELVDSVGGRKFLTLLNNDDTKIIYIGETNAVTADEHPVTGGWPIGPNEMKNIPLGDPTAPDVAVKFFVIVASGTAKLCKLEGR